MTGIREIVFDTETTGFDARGDDRITEIGCIEIIDLIPTGRSFHSYINPERDVPDRVVEITGLTREFLQDKPLFAEQAQSFLDFVGVSPLVAHNAEFDKGFINAELERAGYEPLEDERFIDTLKLARTKFPGSPASLDALCKRFNISLTSRSKHGALIDAELLAEVYLDLKDGRERKLELDETRPSGLTSNINRASYPPRPKALESLLTEGEISAHRDFIIGLGGDAEDMIWQKIWKRSEIR